MRPLRALRRHDPKIDALAKHPLLAGCSPDELSQIASAGDEMTVPAGGVLAREGRVGRWFFLIVDGTAELLRSGHRVGELWAGSHVGELTLTDTSTSPWTVRARVPLTVFAADRRAFAGLVASIPSLRRALVSSVATRLRDEHHHVLFEVRDSPELHDVAPAPPRRRRWQRIAWVAVGLQLAISASLLYHPPTVVLSPGRAIDISDHVSIAGIQTDPPGGRYLLVTVDRERPTLGALATVPVRAHADVSRIHPPEAPTPSGRAEFLRSRDAAIAAAHLGIASGPYDVRLADLELTGPSGGLIYALAIADMLDPTDLASGRTIAATGTIDEHGTIGRVGGVHQKAVAAVRAGADVFIAPEGQGADASGFGMRIIEAATLADAIAALNGSA